MAATLGRRSHRWRPPPRRRAGTEVLARVEAGRSVLVAGQVGEECDPPTGARLVTADTGLELLPTGPRIPEGLLCEALSRAVVVLAVDPDLVPTGTRIGGQPADAPAG